MKKQVLILSLLFSTFGIAEEFKKAQGLVAAVEVALSPKAKEKRDPAKSIDVSLNIDDPKSEVHLILGILSKNGIKPKACDPESCHFELGELSAKRLVDVLKEIKEKDESIESTGKAAIDRVPTQYYMSNNVRFETLTACKAVAEKVPDSNCYIIIPKDGGRSSRSIVKNGKTLATGMSQVDVSKFKIKNPECRRELAILDPCTAVIDQPKPDEWQIVEAIK